MAKVLIMYYSKYGTTKKYAEWLASELDGTICDIKKIKQENLAVYDTIILGSGLYAGNVRGLDIFVNNYETIKNKKLIVFTCGLADVTVKDNIEEIRKKVEAKIPERIQRLIKIFNVRGGIDYKKLTLTHRFMMWILNKALTHKPSSEVSQENTEFMDAYGKTADFMNKDYIAGIVTYCSGQGDNVD